MRPWLVGSVVFLLALPAWASVGKVTALEGHATRTPEYGAEEALAEGSEIEAMDTLRVQDGALEITLDDDSVLALSAGSELQLTQAVFQPQERSVFAFLRSGSLWTSVRKALEGERSRFEVSTDRAIAGVRGTVFRVDVSSDTGGAGEAKGAGDTLVSVEEGLVQVDPREPEAPSSSGTGPGAIPPPDASRSGATAAFRSRLIRANSAVRVGFHRLVALAFQQPRGVFAQFIERRRARALQLRLGKRHPKGPNPDRLDKLRERLEQRRERRRRP